jgi:ectoine hydroxylase-related dioxygenase (phytanoyl-CoA dioxygenase family)
LQYVVFLALQDVTEDMGPTAFLLKTHTEKAIKDFESVDPEKKNDQLRKADCRLATLKRGDAVLFDARVLHAGGANDINKGANRVMFNFSFRNPKVKGDIGYKGSIMPGYVGAMNLGDIGKALNEYAKGETEPFADYGNGIC